MAFTLTGESGVVRFSAITDESVDLTSKITSNPVEDGAPINDHMVNEQIKFSISGKLVGDSLAGRATLESFRDNREFLTYEGIERVEECLINSLKFSHSADNATGVDFSASLQKVRIAVAETVAVSGKPKMSEQDKSAVTSKSTAASSQTKPKSRDGRKTTDKATVSSNSYANYVNSFNDKNVSTETAQARSTASYSGIKGG